MARVRVDPESEVPALVEGWGGYVIHDLNGEESLYRQARNAVAEYDYAGAAELIREALNEQPEQPVLSLLLAWIHEFSARTELSRMEQRDALQRVLRSGAGDLVQLITRLNFASFSDRELYFLLREQPADQRSAGNWANLSEMAVAVGRYAEALEAAEQAIRLTPELDRQARAELNQDRIHLLLQLQRANEAAEVAAEIEAAEGVSTRILAQLGDQFGSAGLLATADSYFLRALENGELDETERYGLLTRQARWHSGPTRWRLLLEAAEILPVDNGFRNNLVSLIQDELSAVAHAEVAGELASEADSMDISISLKLRQAELTADPAEAVEIGIALYRNRQLPADRLVWLMQALIEAQRHADVIEILEQYLRNGGTLAEGLLTHLGAAYRAVGRPDDAIRATSHVREKGAAPATIGVFTFSGGGGGFFRVAPEAAP